MLTSTLTPDGQITVPEEIRELLGLEAGRQVEFLTNAAGEVVLRRKKRDARELRGIVKPPFDRPVTLEEMDEAIMRGAVYGEGA